jgi:hypothetical protein
MNAPARRTEVQTLDQLARDWLAAKAVEDEARCRRVEIEADLLLHSQPIAEGTDRVETEATKLAVNYKVTRKIDSVSLGDCWGALPDLVRSCFKWSADVDLKTLRALQLANPGAYAQAARFITAAPAKPAVKVELKEAV